VSQPTLEFSGAHSVRCNEKLGSLAKSNKKFLCSDSPLFENTAKGTDFDFAMVWNDASN
jgi:hypothetical protein